MRLKVFYLTAIIALLLDQLSKFLFNGSSLLLTNWFGIVYTENIGASFGILKGQILLFVLAAAVVILIIFNLARQVKKDQVLVQVLYGLLLGGVIGNMLDRIFFGYVRDFIYTNFWPTFNFADSFVTVSLLILLYLSFRNKV